MFALEREVVFPNRVVAAGYPDTGGEGRAGKLHAVLSPVDPGAMAMFAGYDIRHRYNCTGQPVTDISFQFIAKTVPANGETMEYIHPDIPGGSVGGFLLGHECVDQTVGAWNRSFCENPIKGTGQLYQHVCTTEGQKLIPGTDKFDRMFEIPICVEDP